MSSYDELIQKCEKPPYTWGSLGSGYCAIVPASDPIFDLLGGDDAPAHAELICLCVNEYAQLRAVNERLRLALKFYADIDNWTSDTVDIGVGSEEIPESSQVALDHGNMARLGLAEATK